MPIQNVSIYSLSFRGTNGSGKQGFKTQKEIEGGKTKLALALGALAVTGAATAGIARKTRKGTAGEKNAQTIQNAAQNSAVALSPVIQEDEGNMADLDGIKPEVPASILTSAIQEDEDITENTVALKPEDVIAEISEKSNAGLQDVMSVIEDIQRTEQEALELARDVRNICGDYSIVKYLRQHATPEGKRVKLKGREFITQKLDDGTGRFIVILPKAGFSILYNKDDLMSTIKMGDDKIYFADGKISQILKGYSSEGEIKKADRMFDVYSKNYQEVYDGFCSEASARPMTVDRCDRCYAFRIFEDEEKRLKQYSEGFEKKHGSKFGVLYDDWEQPTIIKLGSARVDEFDTKGNPVALRLDNIDYILKDGEWVVKPE